MPKHRRYPVKQKGKSFKMTTNPSERLGGQSTKGQVNRPPSKHELKHQAVPRRRKLAQEPIEQKKEVRKSKNKFYELTAQMGYKKNPWEDDETMVHRVLRKQNFDLGDELMKARMGIAGRSTKELQEDYKELDEKERHAKMLKVQANEKRRKLREKDQRFRESHLAKQTGADEADENSDGGDELDDEAENTMAPDAQNEEVGSKKADAHAAEDESKDAETTRTAPRRLSNKKKERLKRQAINDDRSRNLMLNAREIIPFGERTDAPPEFSSYLKKKWGIGQAQAGSKDLLLKRLMPNEKTKTKTTYIEPRSNYSEDQRQERPEITEHDRTRVIQAYRQLKKKR